MKEITVLKVAPMCVPEVVTLKNDLRSLQEAVSIDAPSVGLIEIINLDSKTAILCNEEGKLLGLAPNRRLGCDVLCGVFYVVGQDGRGNLTSLSPKAMERCKKIFAVPEVIDPAEVEATLMAMFYSL